MRFSGISRGENAHVAHSMSASANLSANGTANGTLRAAANGTVEDILQEVAQQATGGTGDVLELLHWLSQDVLGYRGSFWDEFCTCRVFRWND